MKSNYKRLGPYIREVDLRNKEGKRDNLLGVSVSKVFINSIANTVGTDFTKYKVVKKSQFTYIPDTSRRGDKIGIALLEDKEEALVSQAYTVFEIIDTESLLPEYLMMWFRRPEFDRYARFISHGSVREIFSWEDMCDVELPIPSIAKQKEIVKEYDVLVDKIKLNNDIIKKLEETVQVIYKQWFVDFEFPDENGKPYKSNRGEMELNKEFDKEIPLGWEVTELGNIIEIYDSKRVPLSNSERAGMEKLYPYYGAASLMDYVDDYIFDGTYLLLGEDGSVVSERGTPILQYVWGKFWVNNHAHILQGKNGFNVNGLYTVLDNTNITDIITGGVQSKISQGNLNSIKVLIPDSKGIEKYHSLINPIFEYKKNLMINSAICHSLGIILHSKLATLEETL